MVRFISQLSSYILVGIGSNFLGYLLYLLGAFWLDPKVAMTVLYFTGIGISYIGNRKFTFPEARSSSFTLIRYFAVYLLGYILNLFLILFFVDILGYQHQLVQGIAILLVAIFLFIGLRFMVFTHPR